MDGETEGCWCIMTIKAQIPEATCWLAERTDYQFGWKREWTPIVNLKQ